MINYNLYASAAKIQALVDQINGVPESGPDSDYEPINSAKAGYARNPNRKKIIGTQKQWKFISGKGFPGPVKIFLFFLTGFY